MGSILNFSIFEFDLEFQKCSLNLESGALDLQLTPTEFRIFLALARKEGIPVSRDELMATAWKSLGVNIESRGIDTHIAHLRKKLMDYKSVIVSIYGKGYAADFSKVAAPISMPSAA